MTIGFGPESIGDLTSAFCPRSGAFVPDRPRVHDQPAREGAIRRSLELLGRDPGARGVKVVIVDLSGAVIDEGFGAASLEQVLDAVDVPASGDGAQAAAQSRTTVRLALISRFWRRQ